MVIRRISRKRPRRPSWSRPRYSAPWRPRRALTPIEFLTFLHTLPVCYHALERVVVPHRSFAGGHSLANQHGHGEGGDPVVEGDGVV